MQYDINIFEEVKRRVSMREVVSFYGFTPNRSNMIYCPFHDEKTPSMRIYDTHFHCFGCGVHGDSIKFVQLLYKLPAPIDSAKKINSDFGLGIQTERQTTAPPKPQEREPTQSEIYSYFVSWINTAWIKINSYYKLLHRWNEMYKPTAEQPLPWQYAVVCEDLSIIRYICELFLSSEYEYIYMNYRKDIEFYYGKYKYFKNSEE